MSRVLRLLAGLPALLACTATSEPCSGDACVVVPPEVMMPKVTRVAGQEGPFGTVLRVEGERLPTPLIARFEEGGAFPLIDVEGQGLSVRVPFPARGTITIEAEDGTVLASDARFSPDVRMSHLSGVTDPLFAPANLRGSVPLGDEGLLLWFLDAQGRAGLVRFDGSAAVTERLEWERPIRALELRFDAASALVGAALEERPGGGFSLLAFEAGALTAAGVSGSAWEPRLGLASDAEGPLAIVADTNAGVRRFRPGALAWSEIAAPIPFPSDLKRPAGIGTDGLELLVAWVSGYRECQAFTCTTRHELIVASTPLASPAWSQRSVFRGGEGEPDRFRIIGRDGAWIAQMCAARPEQTITIDGQTRIAPAHPRCAGASRTAAGIWSALEGPAALTAEGLVSTDTLEHWLSVAFGSNTGDGTDLERSLVWPAFAPLAVGLTASGQPLVALGTETGISLVLEGMCPAQPCGEGRSCVEGRCVCEASACEGCCRGELCHPGDTLARCGGEGLCQRCDARADRCSGDGCQCGPGAPCETGQRCNDGACVCDPASCEGCCEGAICRAASMQSCGSGGETCGVCDPARSDRCESGGCGCGDGPACAEGSRCQDETCVCDATSCAGCCDGDTCRTGGQLAACGSGGGVCASCATSEVDRCAMGACACGSGPACSAGSRCDSGVCVCDSTTCPDGCCKAGACTSRSLTSCGNNGQACYGCPTNRADACTEQGCRCGTGAACGTNLRCVNGLCII